MKVERQDGENRVTFDVAAAPRTVWQIMTDVARWPEWTSSVRSVRAFDEGGGPLAVGQRFELRQPKFPPARWTVVDVQPETSFTWASRAPGVLATAIHTITPLGDGRSRVSLVIRHEGILGRWLERMTRGITAAYLEMEAEGLKRRSESAGA